MEFVIEIKHRLDCCWVSNVFDVLWSYYMMVGGGVFNPLEVANTINAATKTKSWEGINQIKMLLVHALPTLRNH